MQPAFPSRETYQFCKDPTMASLAARLILPLLLLFGICRANLIRGGGDMVEAPQKVFDYLALSLSWPGTLCINVMGCCSTNACCRSDAVTGFTIYGFWPDYNDGTWPSCCEGSKFDENKISNLMNDLNMYWPSYFCASSSVCNNTRGSVWANQWAQHGTCTSPVLRNQYEYFSTALMLYFKYNVTEVLIRSGYVPSNSNNYPLEGITSAIQNAFKVTPIVTCYEDALREVQICFNKMLKPQDCPTQSSSGCPSRVRLPIRMQHSW